MNKLLLGDEAIALGALHAGLSGVYAYPGTPSTEITEFIQRQQSRETDPAGKVCCQWCTNEKTAMEGALGMSYMGKRALVCMKHVGMNVAADAFVNSAMTGTNGGLVVVAADDPSMHSSQNEQDSRFYGKFALIPIFEPASQQEAYDMIREAFDFSERHHIPVLMRITTRMAHSRAVVKLGKERAQNAMSLPENPKQWILLPANSRQRYPILIDQQRAFEKESFDSAFNEYFRGEDKSRCVVACGIAYNYLMENYPNGCPFSVLKIAQYPLPTLLIDVMIEDGVKEVLVMEEGQPVVEEMMRGLIPSTISVAGRLTGDLPRTGELTPDTVRKSLGLPMATTFEADPLVVPRPPALCQGCGHRDVYAALNEVAREYENARIFSDIGCYTLGALPPLRAIHSCVDMGASITMAKGASDAGQFPSFAVIGDSTFTHSGITGLLDCVNSKSNVVVIISDNLTTAMTGGQDSAGTGRLERICEGIGVLPEHIRVVIPLPKNMEEIKNVLREEVAYKGVSVIIPRRECIQTLKRHAKKATK
ncbi:MAG: thiamine pyrophosphate-dependent enzyme [Alistipes sp.]